LELSSPLDIPDLLKAQIQSRAPDFRERAEAVGRLLPSFMQFVHSTGQRIDAVTTVVTLATNDVLDLLFDSIHGRGRAALRTARSLFELLVTAIDVLESKDVATRYMDQRWVGMWLESQLSVELDHLPSKERRQHSHRLYRLKRQATEPYKAALDAYGQGFARQWLDTSLKDRAEAHGLASHYAFYRFASLVLHGSAGGIMGLQAEIEDEVVNRTGQALSLCPLALLEGSVLFERLVRRVGKRGGPASKDLSSALRDLRKSWPAYRRSVLSLDREMWPDRPPPGVNVLVAVRATGSEEWWMHDSGTGGVCRARRPEDMTEDQETNVTKSIDVVKEYLAHHYPEEWIAIWVAGVQPIPAKGARWQPEGILFRTLTFRPTIRMTPQQLLADAERTSLSWP
jgi:Family of unknown function (DUF5677)